MKVKVTFDVTVISARGEVSERDGKTYYKISCESIEDGEAGTLKCTEEVANAVKRFEKYTLMGLYNDKYDSFRVVGAWPLVDKK